jgi:hypothetical protein
MISDMVKYLWLRDETRKPVACIAYSVENPPQNGKKTGLGQFLRMGVSICNPKDQLDKLRGRQIALGRHDKRGLTAESRGTNAVELEREVLANLLSREMWEHFCTSPEDPPIETPTALKKALELAMVHRVVTKTPTGSYTLVNTAHEQPIRAI